MIWIIYVTIYVTVSELIVYLLLSLLAPYFVYNVWPFFSKEDFVIEVETGGFRRRRKKDAFLYKQTESYLCSGQRDKPGIRLNEKGEKKG